MIGLGTWTCSADMHNKLVGIKTAEFYCTYRVNAFRIFEDYLNQRAMTIYDTEKTRTDERSI